MASRVNQGGEALWAEAEPGNKEDLKQEKEVFRANKNAPWFQEKKGSVFPGKKKLVKTMMAERLAKSLSSKMSTTPSESSKGKKSVEIFPENNAAS